MFRPRSSSRHFFLAHEALMEMARMIAAAQGVNKAAQALPPAVIVGLHIFFLVGVVVIYFQCLRSE